MIKNTEFIEKLRSSGLRPTKQRLKICEVLFNRIESQLENIMLEHNYEFYNHNGKGLLG